FMRNSFLAAAISAGAFVVSLSAAQAGTLIPVPPVQGSTQTWIGDINESNIIAGDYFTPDGNVHGFFGTLDGQYTFFDHPDGHTIVHGISNDGYITGTSNSLSQDCPAVGCTFVRWPDGAIFAVEKAVVPVDGFADEVIQRGRFVGEQWYVDQNLEQLFIYGYYGKGRADRADL